MDIKKIEEIVENSKLSDEAKDMIYKLLPEAEKPEVKEEIMRLVDYEIDMNETLASEAEEIIAAMDAGEAMMDAAEKAGKESAEETMKEVDEKLEALDSEMKKIDEEVQGAVAGGSSESVVAPEEPVIETPVVEAPAEPVAPALQQPAVTPEPVAAPQWNQPTAEQQAQPASDQPAPFPSTQTNQ